MSASVYQILILAVIQGAAELLPISSSAHVILAEKLMGLDPGSPAMAFVLVMLHTGTMFAVASYFCKRWKALATSRGEWAHLLTMILMATACTGVLGLGLKVVIERLVLARPAGQGPGEIEHLFRSVPLISTALAAVGALILVAGLTDRPGTGGAGIPGPGAALTLPKIVLIGIAQGLALAFRGFSRSGATISTAMLCRVPRMLAEDFSFALAIVLTPPVIAYELRRLLRVRADGSTLELIGPGLFGMLLSFVAGLLALRWLSSWLERGRWQYFGYYCVFMAAVLAVAYYLGL